MQDHPERQAAADPASTRDPKVPVADLVEAVLVAIRRLTSKGSGGPTGVPLAKLQTLAKRYTPHHELAVALWDRGGQEARVVAALVDDPACVTPEQMERWWREFDSWAVCEAACFHLFDRTLFALDKVAGWSRDSGELQKRAAFALLAGVALHDEGRPDAAFERLLPVVEAAAADDRSAVKKAVVGALKAIGGRSAELNAAAVAVARRLADSADEAPRWVGMDALRALTGPAADRRLAARTRSTDR